MAQHQPKRYVLPYYNHCTQRATLYQLIPALYGTQNGILAYTRRYEEWLEI